MGWSEEMTEENLEKKILEYLDEKGVVEATTISDDLDANIKNVRRILQDLYSQYKVQMIIKQKKRTSKKGYAYYQRVTYWAAK